MRKEDTISLDISTREVGNTTMLDCAERIILGRTKDLLRRAIRMLVKKRNKNTVINLLKVDYIDATKIGELVSA